MDLRSIKKISILASCIFGKHWLIIQKHVKKYPRLLKLSASAIAAMSIKRKPVSGSAQ